VCAQQHVITDGSCDWPLSAVGLYNNDIITLPAATRTVRVRNAIVTAVNIRTERILVNFLLLTNNFIQMRLNYYTVTSHLHMHSHMPCSINVLSLTDRQISTFCYTLNRTTLPNI